MRRWTGPAATFLIAAMVGHLALLHAAPGAIMRTAMNRMAERGVPLHRFVLSPRTTPQTQTIVRPSPDLAYSVCRYDFDAHPSILTVRMAPYEGYQSVSFFDDETNNFLTVRGRGESRTVRLAPSGKGGPGLVASPSTKGLILIRRLAPDDAAYEQVRATAPQDACDAT